MAKALTSKAVEKMQPDPERRLEVPDGLLPGLYLVVQPSGAKSWAVRFRAHLLDGRPRGLFGTLRAAFEIGTKQRSNRPHIVRRAGKGQKKAGNHLDYRQV